MKHRVVKGNFYGISKVKYIGHGDWADPEVIYKRYSFNYWDVEDALWNAFLDEKEISDYKGNGREFDEEYENWVFNNQEVVHSMVDDWIYFGCYRCRYAAQKGKII